MVRLNYFLPQDDFLSCAMGACRSGQWLHWAKEQDLCHIKARYFSDSLHLQVKGSCMWVYNQRSVEKFGILNQTFQRNKLLHGHSFVAGDLIVQISLLESPAFPAQYPALGSFYMIEP
jgi:hypothetical protein